MQRSINSLTKYLQINLQWFDQSVLFCLFLLSLVFLWMTHNCLLKKHGTVVHSAVTLEDFTWQYTFPTKALSHFMCFLFMLYQTFTALLGSVNLPLLSCFLNHIFCWGLKLSTFLIYTLFGRLKLITFFLFFSIFSLSFFHFTPLSLLFTFPCLSALLTCGKKDKR